MSGAGASRINNHGQIVGYSKDAKGVHRGFLYAAGRFTVYTAPGAGTQANQLIEEARAAAARVQEQETQKAVTAAEQIIAKARQAAEADHARMLAELRREVGRLVVQTTAKVTGKVLTTEDQQRLAEETNKELAA